MIFHQYCGRCYLELVEKVIMNFEAYLALDTEFVWNKTYYARLGLIQAAYPKNKNILNYSLPELIPCGKVSDSQELLLIDPFEAYVDSLASALENSSIVKILHASIQDLQHLHIWSGALPKNIFDTSMAAAYCGLGAGISLQKLFKEILGVELPKTETQSDWCRRPLTHEQLEYAIDDVVLLPAAAEKLCELCKQMGTYEFLCEDLSLLDAPELYEEHPIEQTWKKFSPGPRLLKNKKATARYCALVAWREELARRYDVPRVRIAENKAVHEMSLHLPSTIEAAYAAGIKRNYITDYMDAFPDIKNAELPSELVEAEEPDSFAIERFVSIAKPIVEKLSDELHIDKQYVASKRDLVGWYSSRESEDHKLNKGWRAELLLPKLLKLV